jgi:acid phosphatase type 7
MRKAARHSRLRTAVLGVVLLLAAPASAGTMAGQSASVAATITGVSPMSGAVGSAVTITGTNFVNVSKVTFYDSPSPSFTVSSPTSITAVVPAGTPSPGRWRVVTPDGTAVFDPLFTVTGAPTITSVSPMSGPVGSTVTITGANFANVTKVTFYDSPSPNFTVNSSTSITAVVPAGTPSPGRWRVINPAYTAVYDPTFTVTGTPTITSISPTSGPVGSTVTITGSNFANVTNVTFYDSPSPSWKLNSPTSITAVVPAGTPSPGRWRVVNPAYTAVYDPTFTVTGTPTITSVSPMSGPIGSTVTITGSNFVNVTSVTFYDSPSPNFTINSPTSITATVPSGTPSPGRWRVVNPATTAVYNPLFTVSGDTTAPTTPTGLTISGATQTSIAMTWGASSDNVGVTGYDVYRNGTLAGTSTTTNFSADLLTCATTYSFTVQAKDAAGNLSGQSTSVSGSTSACATADPAITAAGDICNSSTSCAPTATLVEQINPTRALTLGDNAYNDGSLTQYNSYYNPNWGRFKSKTSPSPGNHEYHISGAADYFTYFGSTLAPGPYYSYDIGSWHLISLASSSGISPSAGGAEETWLKQDLAAHQNKCILAYWHEPRWSSGTTHGSSSSWSAVWNDLYAAHADLVLNGHEHNYERFAKQNPSGAADPNGIREFVVGTGGASHGYPFGTPLANSQVRNDSTWGVLKLTLHPAGYDWQFVPIAGSTFTDSGSDTCS